MPTDDELDELLPWVSGLEYAYYGAGWLKAQRLAEFSLFRPQAFRRGDDLELDALREKVVAFMAGEADDPALRRRIVAAWLWNELCDQIPEHAEWSGLVGCDWQPADEPRARAAFDAIVAEGARWCAQVAEGSPEDAADGGGDEGPDEGDEGVDYGALREAFFERLFDPSSVSYFVQRAGDSPGGRTVADVIEMRLESTSGAGPAGFGSASPRIPALIGLDRRVIAVFWFN